MIRGWIRSIRLRAIHRLRLREREGTRVLKVAAPADRLPAGGEVAVEIDSVRIDPGGCVEPVGVEILDHPDVRAGRLVVEQLQGDCHPGALGPVDAADDEDRVAAREVAEVVGPDRPAFDRVPEDDRLVVVGDWGRGGAETV